MMLLLGGLAMAGPACEGPIPPSLDDDWRPTLSGPVEVFDDSSGWFRVHATRVGGDAAADDDGDGTPDLAEVALRALESAHADFVAAGWRELARDGGLGGGDAIDVYVLAIDANGYANPIPAAEGEGASCFIRLDPSILRLGEDVAASVARHELHHCVQYRYTTESATWVYEGQATLEQYRTVAPGALSIGLGVLWALRLSQPDRAIDAVGDRFEYAAFLWFKFWEDRGGDLPELWEELAEEPRWRPAMHAAGQAAFGHGIEALALEHHTWNTAACARDDGRHYTSVVAPCTAPGAAAPVRELAAGEGFSATLDGVPLTSTAATWPADAGAVPVVRCAVTSGEALVSLGHVGSDGVVAWTVYGPAAEVRGAVSGPGLTRIVVTSVGSSPLDARCELTTEAVTEAPRGCTAAPGPVAGWLGIVGAAWITLRPGRRRRRR